VVWIWNVTSDRAARAELNAPLRTQLIPASSERYRGSAELAIEPALGTGGRVEFGVETSDSWPRIASKIKQKAKQAETGGGGWLRVDLLDGSWVRGRSASTAVKLFARCPCQRSHQRDGRAGGYRL
jgi:hypothetical protein